MATHATIKAITPGEPWSNDFGTFHPFTLTTDAFDKPVSVNRKPDSPALQIGQQVWVETQGERNGVLRGKLVAAPDQQGSFSSNGSGHDDVTRRSIEAQVALKAAVEYETRKDALAAANNGALGSSMDVTVTAGIFLDWLKGQS